MIRVFFICSEEESHGVHTGGYLGCLLRRFFFSRQKSSEVDGSTIVFTRVSLPRFPFFLPIFSVQNITPLMTL